MDEIKSSENSPEVEFIRKKSLTNCGSDLSISNPVNNLSRKPIISSTTNIMLNPVPFNPQYDIYSTFVPVVNDKSTKVSPSMSYREHSNNNECSMSGLAQLSSNPLFIDEFVSQKILNEALNSNKLSLNTVSNSNNMIPNDLMYSLNLLPITNQFTNIFTK